MFENYKTFSYDFAGKPLVLETGKMAGLANGSVLVRYGDTAILACATASAKPRDGIDFLPLSIDFEERLYAVGRIPGSYLKREGRPSEKAILTARVIDRPIRPLFPKDLRNDVVISLLVLAVDHDASPEIAGMIGASVALAISDIPWNGPIGGVFMGLTEEEGLIINPSAEQRERSFLELTVAGTKEKVVMIEAGAAEVSDDKMYEAIMTAHEEIKKLVAFIDGVVAEVGKPKFEYPSMELDHDMFDEIFAYCEKDVMNALDTDDKNVRDERMQPIEDDILAKFSEKYEGLDVMLPELIYKIQKKIVRRWLLEDKKRVDGRRMDQIRPLAAEVHLFDRDHGSGMFTRGQTQVLTIATLGSIGDVQMLDGISEEETKRYMHHYNMPGYSVGEAKASRSPADPGASLRGRVPLRHPLRIRGHQLQRLHLPGVRLRLHPRPHGRGRSDQGSRGRYLLRSDHRRGRQLDHHDRHPGPRGLLRRHGLQGGRHPQGHHRHPDGPEDRRSDSRDH